MKRRTLLKASMAVSLSGLMTPFWTLQAGEKTAPMAFASGGSKKMLYDVRQRPQAIYWNDQVFIGYKGWGTKANENPRNVAPTHASLVRYDPVNRTFSSPIKFGEQTSDHHDCPVLWVDKDEHMHVMYRMHNRPGHHLVNRKPGTMGESEKDWEVLPDISEKVSYPTMFALPGGRHLVYFREAGHSSSWSYRITADNGRSWTGPEHSVTNLDIYNHPEWSSYQAKILSPDKKHLYVVFTDYDDVKSNDPERLYNPKYDMPVSNEWKYNLSLLKIDLATHEVRNDAGEVIKTPLDIETARARCQIWDTGWRGAGVPPALCLDENGQPSALHVLSEDNLETHNYYYVRKVGGAWKKTPITASNHQWNSGYLKRDQNGKLHAYVIVGEGYQDKPGVNYTHGGGRIEHWVSSDKGNSWSLHREITPDAAQYPGWAFNNVQPVVRPDGSAVEGMLIFYGWLDETKPDGVAFLLDESGLAG
ncbi:MAG: BNR-4 repeat-containing protein [Xanthomonadales bacterium]|jgi:hypothetical protein|nr:BNR-4 repeat-containing protein [Xanthomonadales bacterium]